MDLLDSLKSRLSELEERAKIDPFAPLIHQRIGTIKALIKAEEMEKMGVDLRSTPKYCLRCGGDLSLVLAEPPFSKWVCTTCKTLMECVVDDSGLTKINASWAAVPGERAR